MNLSFGDEDKNDTNNLATNCENEYNDEEDEEEEEGEEDEQSSESLMNAIASLSSHMAQIQLRLAQIIGDTEQTDEWRRERLHELNAFANRGVPNLMLCSLPQVCSLSRSHQIGAIDEDDQQPDDASEQAKSMLTDYDDEHDQSEHDQSEHDQSAQGTSHSMIDRERARQRALILDVRERLHQLEQYAYESGGLQTVPSAIRLERQNAIIEQIASRLPTFSSIALDEQIDRSTCDQLRDEVDRAVQRLITPSLEADRLTQQLQTQIADLERYIGFVKNAANQMEGSTGNGKGNHSVTALAARIATLFRIEANRKSHGKATKPNRKLQKNKLPTTSSQQQDEPKKDLVCTNPLLPSSSLARMTSSVIGSIIADQHHKQSKSANICSHLEKMLPNQEVTNKQPSNEPHLESNHHHEQQHWGKPRARLEMAIERVLKHYNYRSNRNDNDVHDNSNSKQSSNSSDIDRLAATEDSDYTSDSDISQESMLDRSSSKYQKISKIKIISKSNLPETNGENVCDQLANALRDLMQHGLRSSLCTNTTTITTTNLASNMAKIIMPNTAISSGGATSESSSIFDLIFGCFATCSRLTLASPTPDKHPIGRQTPSTDRRAHAWNVFRLYYAIHNGDECVTASHRLSQSFDLPIHTDQYGGARAPSADVKCDLLMTIDRVERAYQSVPRSQYRRSMLDARFRSFVHTALRERTLVAWLRIILRDGQIITRCYEPWSYAATIGFDDALQRLNQLSRFDALTIESTNGDAEKRPRRERQAQPLEVLITS